VITFLSQRGTRLRRWVALLALFGLVGRAAAPVLAMPILSAALLAEAGICHAAGGEAPAGIAPDCQACALCNVVAQPADLPAPAMEPAVPASAMSAAASLPPDGTGPPLAALPFRSRAPPARS
jgi:hypothetical protein